VKFNVEEKKKFFFSGFTIKVVELATFCYTFFLGGEEVEYSAIEAA